ncbi:MAG TPA: hydrogenase maturation protease [Pyrinomonadaceae bacterium]|nr:hydrogenase maturation protease [Pyrinomonadaceae bacterium]
MVLVSGIGYSNLSDMSFGRVLLSSLEKMRWPPDVRVEDLNFGPIMIYQWFEELPVKFEKAVFVHAAKRGRVPGTLEVYSWRKDLPGAAEIQLRIEEAVTGVISLDNLLIICKHFGVLPPEVTIVEIEPEKEDWGQDFSPAVAARVSEALELVRNEVLRTER